MGPAKTWVRKILRDFREINPFGGHGLGEGAAYIEAAGGQPKSAMKKYPTSYLVQRRDQNLKKELPEDKIKNNEKEKILIGTRRWLQRLISLEQSS